MLRALRGCVRSTSDELPERHELSPDGAAFHETQVRYVNRHRPARERTADAPHLAGFTPTNEPPAIGRNVSLSTASDNVLRLIAIKRIPDALRKAGFGGAPALALES